MRLESDAARANTVIAVEKLLLLTVRNVAAADEPADRTVIVKDCLDAVGEIHHAILSSVCFDMLVNNNNQEDVFHFCLGADRRLHRTPSPLNPAPWKTRIPTLRRFPEEYLIDTLILAIFRVCRLQNCNYLVSDSFWTCQFSISQSLFENGLMERVLNNSVSK